jgi:hypothetical protein
VLLNLLVAVLVLSAILLMAMPFLLVRYFRQHQPPATVTPLLPDAGGTD